jgi:hypothetical protein
MRIQVWHGWRAVHNGKDVSRWEWVEFDGEPLGSLVVEHRYGKWEAGGVDYGVVSVYGSIEDAARRGWRDDLVRIGASYAPTRELDEWLSQYEEEE